MESDGPRPEHLLFLPVDEDDLGDGRLVIGEKNDEDGVGVGCVDEAFLSLEVLALDVALLVMDEGEGADELEQFLWWPELSKDRCCCRHQHQERDDETDVGHSPLEEVQRVLHGISPYRFGLSSTSQECSAFECRGLR